MNFQFFQQHGMGMEDDEDRSSHHSHNRQQQTAKPKKEVNTTKFYEALGVPKDANEQDIRKAYRNLARIHHPDRGGDPEKFKEISRAHEVLTDQKKRQLYDQHGEEGVDGNGPSEGPSDIFDVIFGQGKQRGQRQQKRGEDVLFPLKVELSDLYSGATKKLRLTKNVICKGCNGKGGKAENITKCKSCKGHGVKLLIRQLGPGMIQQMQAQCEECHGEGTQMADKDKCKKCNGNKTVKEQKTLEVFINKGMAHGQRVTFKGEADEAPDTTPGDVVVVLQQKEHPLFRRDGANLFFKKKITLVEALCGFSFQTEHLDKRVLRIKSEEGAVAKPGDIKSIRDEGMPHPKNPVHRGNLYIEFEIEFPPNNSLSTQKKEQLMKVLPLPVKKDEKKDKEETTKMKTDDKKDKSKDETHTDDTEQPKETVYEDVQLVDVDMAEERKKHQQEAQQQRSESYEEDDEEHRQHRGEQGCRAQ
jgi:DnaJ family protein A protein 2